jgi:hypothetical protein
MRMFDNAVLRRINRAKREKEIGDSRKLHKEIHKSYYCEIKENEMGRTCNAHGRDETL